jgi:hypothetical protein
MSRVLEIKKTVDEEGYVALTVNGVEFSNKMDSSAVHNKKYSISKNITSTTSDMGSGIFSLGDTFRFGAYSKRFDFKNPWTSDDFSLPAMKIAEKIRELATPVLEWVQECRASASEETARIFLYPSEVEYDDGDDGDDAPIRKRRIVHKKVDVE